MVGSLSDWCEKHRCPIRTLAGEAPDDTVSIGEVRAMTDDLMSMTLSQVDLARIGDMLHTLFDYWEKAHRDDA